MSDELSKMIQLYSLDTSSFYNEEERKIHEKQLSLYKKRSEIKRMQKRIKKNGTKEEYHLSKNLYKWVQKRLSIQKGKLYKEFARNSQVRSLHKQDIRDNKLVGMFETALTREFGIRSNRTTEDIMIVQVYYFDVMDELIRDGFYHNGEKYIYFSSSAGQIRTKKLVFVKESLWKKHENAITCGLSVKEINEKGGANVNKYLAYIALTNSASNPYNDFDIDKCIVVDDLETDVESTVDDIDMNTYEVNRKKRKLPIEHTDGAGMILPQVEDKSFMFRAPFIKGLLVPFPFDKFIKENKGSPKVKDIYGDEWDIEKDDITTIFFKSQFKMKDYYSNWEDYKKRFKKYGCKASKLNEEETNPLDAKMSYQMLQTLSDITDNELRLIAKPTIDEINNISNDEDVQLNILGAKEVSNKSNYFQRAVNRYPELLNDDYITQTIRDKKKSLVHNAKAAKLKVKGKYTFICPDFYAVCERLFLKSENPKGLLGDGEVYCSLFDNKKLDCLRSPHLYREHAVRENVKDDGRDKWFVTNGIYTSIHDPISRILQFDVDGDKSLVIEDELFVEVAERNMEGIYPLYYEMSVAEKDEINPKNIYDSLILAFKANIGEYSNNITKIFNTNERPDLKSVAWLTAENNFIIDYAKSLFMPTRPDWVNKKIKNHTKQKLPHFFRYAKNKKKQQVLSEHKGVVDRLDYIIPDKRLFLNINESDFDYRVLLSDRHPYFNKEVFDKYIELTKNKRRYMNVDLKDKKGKQRELAFDAMAKKELMKIEPDRFKVVDIIIKGIYKHRKYSNKSILWNSFDRELFSNIKYNTKGTKRCEECKIRFAKTGRNDKYCTGCKDEVDRKKAKERMENIRLFDS